MICIWGPRGVTVSIFSPHLTIWQSEFVEMARGKSQRERELDLEIKELLSLADRAEAKGSFAPAVQARSRAATLTGDLARHRAVRLASGIKDPIAQIEAMIVIAQGEGSWAAVANLVKQRDTLVADLTKDAHEAVSDSSDHDLVASLVACLEVLDLDDVHRILAVAQARLGVSSMVAEEA